MKRDVIDFGMHIKAAAERRSHIHAARVFIAQSRHFTHRARGFSFVLLEMAANARRRAAAHHMESQQADLFA